MTIVTRRSLEMPHVRAGRSQPDVAQDAVVALRVDHQHLAFVDREVRQLLNVGEVGDDQQRAAPVTAIPGRDQGPQILDIGGALKRQEKIEGRIGHEIDALRVVRRDHRHAFDDRVPRRLVAAPFRGDDAGGPDVVRREQKAQIVHPVRAVRRQQALVGAIRRSHVLGIAHRPVRRSVPHQEDDVRAEQLVEHLVRLEAQGIPALRPVGFETCRQPVGHRFGQIDVHPAHRVGELGYAPHWLPGAVGRGMGRSESGRNPTRHSSAMPNARRVGRCVITGVTLSKRGGTRTGDAGDVDSGPGIRARGETPNPVYDAPEGTVEMINCC